VNKEDMVHAEDLGNYYRIPADNRDLNYNKFFSEGVQNIKEVVEYNSHNTYRLNLEETKEILLKLPEVSSDINR